MNDDIAKKLHEIKEGEVLVAIEAAKDNLSILNEYYQSNYNNEILKNYSSFYFKNVAILQNAMIRFGMCDYLLEE